MKSLSEKKDCTLLVVGGSGRMGNMLCKAWVRAGYTVLVHDTKPQQEPAGLCVEDLAQACAAADIVVLCVPIVVVDEVLKNVVPHLAKGQILIDIASVKVNPMRQMQAAYAGPVVGTHPLFGAQPQPDELSVCLCPGDQALESHTTMVEAIFSSMGCICFRRTAWEHDKAMAAIQGLNFITNVAYFASLAHHPEYLPFLTPSFHRRKEASETMLTRDAELFEALFEANPLSQEMVRHFRSYLHVAAGGDINILVEKAQWWYEEKKPKTEIE